MRRIYRWIVLVIVKDWLRALFYTDPFYVRVASPE